MQTEVTYLRVTSSLSEREALTTMHECATRAVDASVQVDLFHDIEACCKRLPVKSHTYIAIIHHLTFP